MMYVTGDTITAIATPSGYAGVGVIRVSGPLVKDISQQLLRQLPKPRQATFLPFYDQTGHVIDEGVALYFPAPNSFTGEDVLELQGHGSPVVLQALLCELCHVGARLALAGEFSQRAFLNDKMDLAQAEAIADFIHASTLQGARSALKSMQGEFSKQIDVLLTELISIRVWVESSMDFTDEDIDVMTEGNIQKRLSSLQSQLQRLCQMAQQGVLLQQGMSLLLLGEPNAGKSSLLNYFSQRDSAIVTEIPGTTRDVLRESIQLKGIPVHLIDTAGLRDSTDPIEQEGIKRAWEEASRADVILMVVDSTQYDASALSSQIARVQQVAKETPMIVVYNKTDLLTTTQIDELHCAVPYQCVSVKTSDGMEALAEALVQCVGYDEKQEGCSARLRHVDALQRALTAIEHGASHFQSQGAIELMADDLRIAQQHLSEITGAYTSDDLLGAIFSTFCIGK